jgi:DNA-binding LytR/AlgR family response regulator
MNVINLAVAYEENAVRAFELNAVDYLLKPVDRGRLRETLNRAHQRLERDDFRSIEVSHLQSRILRESATSLKLEFSPISSHDSKIPRSGVSEDLLLVE